MKREMLIRRRLRWRRLVSNLKPSPSLLNHKWTDFCIFSLADACIEKSLLLLRFPPCGPSCHDTDNSKAAEGSSAPLPGSNSISEGDFQASSSVGSPSVVNRERAQSSSTGDQSKLDNKDSEENLCTQPGEPALPSVPTHKTPFSRSRLRLLSCRSIEEPGMASSVKDRYPMIKHILNFIRDQGVTTARWQTVNSVLISFSICTGYPLRIRIFFFSPSISSVVQTLSLSKAQAVSVSKVLEMVQQCLCSLGKPHLFQAPCILFLQELLACQKDFTG